MEKLMFNLGVAKEYEEAKEVSEYRTSKDSKDLDMFANHIGHTIDNKTILSNGEAEVIYHIESKLKEILGAFESKGYTNFKDLKVVYKKSNQGLVGKMFFYEINKPMYLYFEHTDRLRWFIGGECVESGYRCVACGTQANIYNYLAIHALMGVFGMDMLITTSDVFGGINVKYKGRDNKFYRLEVVYSNNKFCGLKKNIRATTIGHWLNAVEWARNNSVLCA